MNQLQLAFKALTSKLETLYGAEHNHDFQAELDALEALINPVEVEANVDSGKANGGPVTGQVSPTQ